MDELLPQDAAVLRMLAGASFGPDSKFTLPSGRELNSDEAQALTSAYAPAADGARVLGEISIDSNEAEDR